jgi:AraC-like DNA-binding protein
VVTQTPPGVALGNGVAPTQATDVATLHERLPALPSCVHQAVCYLRGNLHHAITLGDLIRAADAPERTLHRQFRHALGITPWAYLRTLRLFAARRALSAPGDDTVTAVALNVGYTHFSRFARDYRERFGELPSVTRQRACSLKGASSKIYLSNRPRPFISISPFQATTVQERETAQAMSEHLAAELSRSGMVKVRLITPAVLHQTVADQHYSLLGRLTQMAGQLRLTVRLVDDVTGSHVWAETFDGDADAPFAMQDRVANGVVAGIGPALLSAEINRLLQHPASTIGAREIALRALPWAVASDVVSAQRLLTATDQALDADPADTLSLSLAALGHAQMANYLGTTAPTERREQAIRLSQRAAASAGHDALSLTALASAASSLGRPAEEVERLTVRALTIDPTLGWAWSRMGFVRLSAGQDSSRALADFRRARHFNGANMPSTLILNGFSRVSLAAGSRPNNIAYSLQALAANPRAAWIQVNLICAYQAAGELGAMRQSLSELRAACPELTVKLFADCRPWLPAQCLQIMRDAGLPLS